jgi:predicted phosphodiesterase
MAGDFESILVEMRCFFATRGAFCAAVLCAGLGHAQTLTQVWTEVGDHGTLARVVVNSQSDCPSITVDGKSMPMQVRLPIPQGLKPACELAIPATAKAATVAVEGRALALPHADPARVVVIGDTGCRIKGGKVQDCNDPAKWPFKRVAGSAAESKPDLVIHVGDYLYREEPCPANAQADCGGTPSGDTWEAWDADFFEPATQLLAAAPWAFSRGNHESCDRSWRGWFYYLDPRPFTGTCEAYSAPYLIKLGTLELVMLDSASAAEKTATKDFDPKGVEHYAAELAAIHATHAWLVLHHPLWGLKAPAAGDASGLPAETPNDVTAAWEKSRNKGIDMIVSGHTHLFELLSFDHDRPTQLVAGDGGTDMAMPLPAKVAGLKVGGATLLSGQNLHEFGYTALTRTSPKEPWHLALTSSSNKVLEEATVPIANNAAK